MPTITTIFGLITLTVTPALSAPQAAQSPYSTGSRPSHPSPYVARTPAATSYTPAGYTTSPPGQYSVVQATHVELTAQPAAPAAGQGFFSRSAVSTSATDQTPITQLKRQSSGGDRLGTRTGNGPSLLTVGASLATVLGLFFLAAWFMRRATPAGSLALPSDVFEVLGRAPLASRQQAYLLRCGKKLLLVSITSAGAETLTEITDADEVLRLAGLCRQKHPQSATAAFREVFGQFAPTNPKSKDVSRLFDGDAEDHARVAETGILVRHRESEAQDV